MKKAIIALFLLAPLFAHGQAFRWSTTAQTVNSSAPVKPGVLLPALNIANATVAICNYPANGVPCTNYATTYTDPTGTTTCPGSAQLTHSNSAICVAKSDQTGNVGAWLKVGNYQYTVTSSYGSFGPYDVSMGPANASGQVSTGGSYKLPGYGSTSQPIVGPINITSDSTGNNLQIPGIATATGGFIGNLTGNATSSNTATTATTANNANQITSTGVNGQAWGVVGGVQQWFTPTGSGTVNSGQLALAQYPASSAPSVSPSNITYDTATGNNLTYGTAGNGNANLGSSITSALPRLDIRHPSFAGGAKCDGVTDIGPALQAAWNAAKAVGGQILIPGAPTACYWANPTPYDANINPTGFVWGTNTHPVTFVINGQLNVGTSWQIPAGVSVNIQGFTGGAPSQFQGPGDTARILERPISGSPATGTIGTAVAATYTGTGSPTASSPVVCNSSVAGNIYQDTTAVKSSLWTCATTTGTMSSGSNSLSVVNPGGFMIGDSISVTGAGTSGGTLTTTITAISGSTFTLLANASTTATSTPVVVSGSFALITNGWRVGGLVTVTPSDMEGLLPGTGLHIVDKQSCTITSIARASNVVTVTTAAGCRLPSGVPVTTAGVTDSSFNGTYAGGSTPQSFLLLSSDRVTDTFTYRQVAADATSSGGTITAVDEDSFESVLINKTTSTTATAIFSKVHASTASFGVNGVIVNTTSATNFQDIVVIGDGLALWMPQAGYNILTRVGISSANACGTNPANGGVEINYGGFITFDHSSIEAACDPWAIHLQGFADYSGFTSSGPLYMNWSVTLAGIKSEGGGSGVFLNHHVCEQCARGSVIIDPTHFYNPNHQRIVLNDMLLQDNPNNFDTCAVYTNQPLATPARSATGTVKVSTLNGFSNCVVNDYFQGGLTTDHTSSGPSYGLNTQVGVYGSLNSVSSDMELRGEQAGFSPSVIPHSTENVTTNPASWSTSSCTVTTGILAPDGTLTAGQITKASSTGNIVVGTKTITPAVGDMVLFGVWNYSPTIGSTSAAGASGTALLLDDNASTHYALNTSSSVSTNQWDAQVTNDWWHPVVGMATVTQSDGTAGQSVRLSLQCSAGILMNYWMPWMIYIPASENIPLREVNRWRQQLLHGAVPGNMPSGGGIAATTASVSAKSFYTANTAGAPNLVIPSYVTTFNGNSSAISIPYALPWTTPTITSSLCHDTNGNVTDTGCPSPGTPTTLVDSGQAPVFSPTVNVAGYPSASAVRPDALIQQITAYTTQAATIASVTDTNAKAVLTAMDTYVLNLQTALKNAAIVQPNTFVNLLASTANAVYWQLNPTGASTVTTNISNTLAASATLTWTVAAASGAPNFNPGKSSMWEGGAVRTGTCPNGPATTLLGSDFATASHCGQIITSSSQITSGAASLSNYFYPSFVASSTSLLTGFGVGGFSIILRGYPNPTTWTSGGTASAYSGTPPTFAWSKSNEYQIGPGFCAVYNNGTSAYVTTSMSPDIWGPYTSIHNAQPRQTVLVYDGAGSFSCYENDGTGTHVATGSATLTATSAIAFKSNSSLNYWTSSIVYLPGVKLTQPQVASLYYGWSNDPQPWSVWQAWANLAPSYNTQPGTQWNVHTLRSGDGFFHDCVPLGTFNDGANSVTANYLAQPSFCHAQLTTSAPYVNFGLSIGSVANSNYSLGPSISIHVDGVYATSCDPSSGATDFTCGVSSPSAGSHTYDVTIGTTSGASSVGYTSPNLHSTYGGTFLRNIAVPLPYVMTAVPQTGTVTLCDTDSILCSGSQTINSSAQTFSAYQRYANPSGNNSFGDKNFAVIGNGSRLTSTDWNPTGLTNLAASFPDATAVAFAAAHLTPAITGETLGHVVMQTGVNDFIHGCGGTNPAFTTSSNGLAIFAYALKNAMAEYHTLAPSATIYRLSLLNEQANNETATDGCTGNSYTFATSISIPAYSGGTWTGTYTTTGGSTTLTGAQTLNMYRAVAKDVCTSNASFCTWLEIGPGAANSTAGYVIPTLNTSNATCFVSATQQCFGDTLHLTNWGHCAITKYIDDVLGGTLNTAGFTCSGAK